jgi:site-specific DNA-methyltransferase (adenine-specific)
MGKAWDGSGIAYSVEMWAEVLRVLKPGGHLCAFGGTRTYHRMACAIEDAGFEIRDSLHWVYGSGFPKSLDVSKAIDKAAGAEREVLRTRPGGLRPGHQNGSGGNFANNSGGGLPDILDTAPATDAAKQWGGWGTALKPAHEIIVLARRPLIGTVAANVLTHGTGALNIDGARVGYASEADQQRMSAGVDSIRERGGVIEGSWKNSSDLSGANPASERGRWPANVIFDTEAGALLDEQSGDRDPRPAKAALSGEGSGAGKPTSGTFRWGGVAKNGYKDTGGASRFFTAIEWDDNTDIGIDVPFRYIAKPSKRERNAGLDGLPERSVGDKGNGLARKCATCSSSVIDGCECPDRTFINPTRTNHHPTVKPLALMRWLVRLVTPPGGTVLEPFAGSGTTLMACVMEGFNGIGIEMTDEYLPIIEGRVRWAQHQPQTLDL